MKNTLNPTHDPKLKSWVESANLPECHFPIQNLPFGIFSVDSDSPRAGIAIGDRILDLAVIEEAGLLNEISGVKKVFERSRLNEFVALGKPVWHAVRVRLSELLRHDKGTLRDNAALRARALVAIADARMHLPVTIPGYTDFYSSKEHATNVGSMFRDPKNALLPNWLHMPIGYNGRASSVVVSGTPIRRPMGQLKLPDQENPIFAPCKKLDFELETAFIIGSGNALGEPISVVECGGSHLRHGANERLERTRYSAMGIRATRPVQRENIRHLDLAVDRDDGSLGTVSRSRTGARTYAPALFATRRRKIITTLN